MPPSSAAALPTTMPHPAGFRHTSQSAPNEPPQLRRGLLRLLWKPLERHERQPELRQRHVRPLEAKAPEPADCRPLVMGRIGAAQEQADPESVVEVDGGELSRSGANERQVLGVEGAAEASIGTSLVASLACVSRRRGPYALRHTFATEALAAGVSIFQLARLMGASTEMIDRHYGHLVPDSEDVLRDLLTRRSGGVVATGPVGDTDGNA
jgi:hypothetical protein